MKPKREFKGKILFDAGHAQDAGNADWVIQGAYSAFADTLKEHGFLVTDTHALLTFQMLKKHAALIIAEPNSAFAAIEKQAIIQFIKSGGGVFFIGNHLDSDRNHNGIDSVGVFNQFVDQLGFLFEETNLSAEPVMGRYLDHPVTYKINSIAVWSGTSIKILDPLRVTGLIYFADNISRQAALAVGIYGRGRFSIVSDSAIFDDGSGSNPKDNLHTGFWEFDHQQLALNVINWLTSYPNENI